MAKRWTTKDNEVFKELWELGRSPSSLAKQFNRTESAIREHAYKMGLPPYTDIKSFVTAKYVTDAFGYNTKACNQVFKTIPFVKRKNGNKVINHIEPKAFWKWAYQNRDKVDFSRYKMGSLQDEPKWLEQEMKIIKRVDARKWTIEEDKLLALMYQNDKPLPEIAKRLNRTYQAVGHRASRLNLKRKIKLKKINIRWTEEETEILLKLVSEGKSNAECAYELGREPSHIKDKLYRMKVS